MPTTTKTFNKMEFVDEEGRQDIYHWSERRERRYKGFRKSLHVFQIFAFNHHLLRSFIENFNFMVILQMALAGLITYACKALDIVYDVPVSLFISPIVFPLAFSINTDFQRREKVLEDLANFKSAAMMWFFCMRDWREACCMDDSYMKAVRNKIKGLLFHLREYLLTEKIERRKFIARVIYEDLSDTNQLIEKIRCSQMEANSPLVSRIIHFLNMMCLSFERLRVIREYRSPRSIRSFTKVLIFALPIILSPYYVQLGNKLKNVWSPYYISIMVAFVFGALQGVQDKLDDPFDGMSEDDIKLDTLDEWTFQSLEATVHRTYIIGRFQVSSNPEEPVQQTVTVLPDKDQCDGHTKKKSRFHKPSFIEHMPIHHPHPTKSPMRSGRSMYSEDETTSENFELHPYAGVLSNIQGNTTILRGGHIKKREQSFDDLSSLNNTVTKGNDTVIPFNQVVFGGNISSQVNIKKSASTPVSKGSPKTLQSLFNLQNVEGTNIDTENTSLTSPVIYTSLDMSVADAPLSGVASYLASVRYHSGSCSSNHDSRPSSKNSNASMRSRRSSRSSQISSSETSNEVSKAQFFVGDSKINHTPNSPKLSKSPKTPKSQFFVTNSNTASINPLLNSNMSMDSEIISSSDDDVTRPPVNTHSAEPNGNREQSYSWNGLIYKNVSTAPPLHASHSEDGMYHELRDEEIFI